MMFWSVTLLASFWITKLVRRAELLIVLRPLQLELESSWYKLHTLSTHWLGSSTTLGQGLWPSYAQRTISRSVPVIASCLLVRASYPSVRLALLRKHYSSVPSLHEIFPTFKVVWAGVHADSLQDCTLARGRR